MAGIEQEYGLGKIMMGWHAACAAHDTGEDHAFEIRVRRRLLPAALSTLNVVKFSMKPVYRCGLMVGKRRQDACLEQEACEKPKP